MASPTQRRNVISRDMGHLTALFLSSPLMTVTPWPLLVDVEPSTRMVVVLELVVFIVARRPSPSFSKDQSLVALLVNDSDDCPSAVRVKRSVVAVSWTLHPFADRSSALTVKVVTLSPAR